MATSDASSNIAQAHAPILEGLLAYSERHLQPFHIGHKEGRFFPAELKRILGQKTLAIDLPSTDEIGTTSDAAGCVAEAQALAAQLYGAAHTRYLTQGSTSGVITMMMTATQAGDAILLARNSHRAIFSGLALSGARPIYLLPDSNPNCGALPIQAEAIRAAFRRHPEIKAVLLTRPTYYGVAQDLAEIAQICREQQCPLLIDEAHGAHFAFLPQETIQPALAFPVDLVTQSVHKTLCSLNGSSQIHLGYQSLLAIERLQQMLNLLQSTSPSYLLLASLDAARRMLWEQGPALFAQAVLQAERLRQQINELPGLTTLDSACYPELSMYQFDPLRLVVNLKQIGMTGYKAREILKGQFQIECELEDFYNVVFVLGPFTDEAMSQNLLNALRFIAHQAKRVESDQTETIPYRAWPVPTLVLEPREAVLGKKALIKLENAQNRICSEVITPFPPAIPIICPGEVISAEIIELLQELRANNVFVQATDPRLHHVSVIE
ncbi:MAG: aminotransferase class I/II-fold pyridoxal phosphate-dependent enzyme [Caldilineaceae bacterium]